MTPPPPVILVTGAGCRLGRRIAESLGADGAAIAVHYNSSRDGAEEAAAAIRARGGDAATFASDLSVPGAAEALARAVGDWGGKLDVLVNSAAIMLRTPVGEVSVVEWDRMMAINVRAPFFLSQAATPMLRESRGCIVNIADLAAFESWPAYVPHGMSKAAIVHMTRALARALAPEVRVNAVAPGVVMLPDDWPTESEGRLASTTPLRRLGSPEDVIGAVRYLIGAAYVTGETLIVDGGRHART